MRGAGYVIKRGFFALVTIFVAITINSHPRCPVAQDRRRAADPRLRQPSAAASPAHQAARPFA